MAVNWSRQWKCGKFENAEIRSIGFDVLPGQHANDIEPPDFIVNGSSSARPGFMNYAFQLTPGKYAISHTKVKVAKSVSDVGYFTASRSNLFESGEPKGGTFDLKTGEIVYIGHFALDCNQQPMVWRYYKEDKESFNKYVDSYKSHYKYMDFSNVQFRLFKTKLFGNDFNL